jgi:M6 family metalloprotease-like protein
LIQQTLTAADATIDFTIYDNDGPDGKPNSGDDDGFVDFVAFVHPEIGGECGGATNRNIWSHRWNYSSWNGTEFGTADTAISGAKIKIDDYVIMPGLNCDGQTMVHIGVFSHEFGHAFGLPDLYDTDPQNGASQGIGQWCLMASGSWGGDGQSPDQPTHMSAWAKTFLGWLQPRPVTADSPNVSLEPVQKSRTAALKIPISPTQYYLVEYRPRSGFDGKLPGAGVLIWKVNDTVVNAGLKNNRVNADAANKGIDLVEADGKNDLDRASTGPNPGNRGDAGDPYPGQAPGNRKLDAASNPKVIGRLALCQISDPQPTAMTVSVFVSRNTCQ